MNEAEKAEALRALSSEPWAILPSALRSMVEAVLVGQVRAAAVPILAAAAPEAAGAPPARRPTPKAPGAVAVLPIRGVLSARPSGWGETSYQDITRQFRALLAEPTVKAIVLDVDSPGGSVFGLQELADEIYTARGLKHVTAVANSLMASAAYYLGTQASELVAAPGAMVGSIGTIMVHSEWSKFREMIGLTSTVIASGKYKHEAAGVNPITDEERAHLQEITDAFYGQFVDAVARGRDVKAADVRNGYGEGRVVLADQAKAQGMIDRVATLDQVLGKLGAGAADTGARAEGELPEIVAENKPGGWDPVELRRKRLGLLRR